MAGANWEQSLLGPWLAVAEVKKWLAVWQTTVSLVQVRAARLRPDRNEK